MSLLDLVKLRSPSDRVEPDSRQLKRGEIKNILVQLASESIPDFDFLEYDRGFYTFRRMRPFRHYIVHELIHIGFTLKGELFSCSVASRLNPDLINNSFYNVGFINPHHDLIAIKRGKGIAPFEEAYYFHNGMLETCTRRAAEIFSDIRHYGLPFLDRQFKLLNESETINIGFDYIDSLDSQSLGELRLAVEAESQTRREMQNAFYVELKKRLQAVPGESREFRKHLPNAARELLLLALALKRS